MILQDPEEQFWFAEYRGDRVGRSVLILGLWCGRYMGVKDIPWPLWYVISIVSGEAGVITEPGGSSRHLDT